MEKIFDPLNSKLSDKKRIDILIDATNIFEKDLKLLKQYFKEY